MVVFNRNLNLFLVDFGLWVVLGLIWYVLIFIFKRDLFLLLVLVVRFKFLLVLILFFVLSFFWSFYRGILFLEEEFFCFFWYCCVSCVSGILLFLFLFLLGSILWLWCFLVINEFWFEIIDCVFELLLEFGVVECDLLFMFFFFFCGLLLFDFDFCGIIYVVLCRGFFVLFFGIFYWLILVNFSNFLWVLVILLLSWFLILNVIGDVCLMIL